MKCVFVVLTLVILSNGVLAAPRFILKDVPEGSLKPFWIDDVKNRKGIVMPVKTERIKAFKITEHAVTNRQYIEFLKEEKSWCRNSVARVLADENYLSQFKDDFSLKKGVNPDAPVTNVSWFGAKAFCEHYGMRLPAILEWEYVGIASESERDASRDKKFLSRILEWYSKSGGQSLPAVKTTYENYYGVFDMHGLVWEWVDDFNSILVTGESREDSSLNRNLFCGAGSMNSGDKSNYAAFMRFAFRSSLKGKSTIWNLGFRCVK